MTKDDVMRKVRALLKLGASDNEHESAAAIGRAQALMERYQIEEAMIVEEAEEAEEIRNWEDPIGRAGAAWRGRLAASLARANSCGVYKTRGVLKVYGRATQVAALRYMFEYCEREIDRLAKGYAGNGRVWINNFRLGCVDAIRKAIKDERERMHNEMRSRARATEGALVLVENAIVAVENEQKEVRSWGHRNLRLRNGSASQGTYHSGAREQGRRDGANIYPGGSVSHAGRVGKGTLRIS